MPNLTMDVLHVSAPPKHGAKGYQRMTYWLNMVIFVSHNKSKRGIISGIPTTSCWEIELGSTKTSRSGELFYFPLARQELLTTATAALSRDFCYHAATKKMQHPAGCDMLSCLQKWLCMTLHRKRKWKQQFKIQVLSKGAVYVRYLGSHPSHHAIWFMFPTLWPQAGYHVLLWFEGFFGFDEPRWDWSLWDQDCRQEGQNSLRIVSTDSKIIL